MNRQKNKAAARLSIGAFFAALLLLIGLVAGALFGKHPFGSFNKAFAGTGIYHTFFMNASDAADTGVRFVAEATPEAIQEEALKVFGDVTHSKTYCLMRLSDGKIILEQDMDKIIYPASLTKIMTAVLVAECGQDLDATKVRITSNIIEYCNEQNAAVAGYVSGDYASMRDLLYATMLSSGAEACLALARQVTAEYTARDIIYGSEEQFVELMNKKAEELGMTNTHFVTCTGLHDDNHYSTAHDMAILFAYALQNDLLREIMTTKTYTTQPTRRYSDGIELKSTVATAFQRAHLDMGWILGGKTGYTPEAGQCLATLANMEYDGEKTDLILITTGAGDGSNSVQYHAMDAYSVFISQVIKQQNRQVFVDPDSVTEAEEEPSDNEPAA